MEKTVFKQIIEIFGYSPEDQSSQCRSLWTLGACPFTNKPCSKTNHNKTVVYGVCSVTSPYGDCIICPNRLYENHYNVLRTVAEDSFGGNLPFYTYEQFISNRSKITKAIVALGINSGREVQVGNQLSMDWVLASIHKGKLLEYTGIEVQSIDITGNYRDNWYAYKNWKKDSVIPPSEHGMNWANVHKRLIPQIIRKGMVYSHSTLVKSGLYFIVPEVVYQKFEEIIGKDIPLCEKKRSDVITVYTYGLSPPVPLGEQRHLQKIRQLRFSLNDFSSRFISDPNLPSGEELDDAVRKVLGLVAD